MRSTTSPACFAIALAAVAIFTAGCKGELRGRSVRSPDGKTYLVVDDNNGGACGSIFVDRRPWPHGLHAAGAIAPGVHQIACGDPDVFISFEVRAGTTFHFDYWGP